MRAGDVTGYLAQGTPIAAGVPESIVMHFDRDGSSAPLANQARAGGELRPRARRCLSRPSIRNPQQLAPDQCRQAAMTALLKPLGQQATQQRRGVSGS